MGSIGSSLSSMSFQDAEEKWAVEFPDKGSSDYKSMAKALSKEIENPNSDYNGTTYRGIDLADYGIKSEADIRKVFKVGSTISNQNKRDFQSWSWELESAQDYANWGSNLKDSRGESVHVVIRSKNGIEGSVKLPGTEGSMNEVLTRGSNEYQVTGIHVNVQDPYTTGYGAKVYFIDVKQVRRRKK